MLIWLINLRRAANKSQKDIAIAAQISQASYCNIENGRRKPAVKTAQAIASALGFDWTKFFET